MHPRTLRVLEFDKIIERLAAHCAFSGGVELVAALLPSDDLQTVQERLEQTSEAYRLLEQRSEISFGGVKDMRTHLERAERRVMLLPVDLSDIKMTLMRARSLRNLLTRLENSFPKLAEIAYNIEPCEHLIDEIGRCVNDRSEVVDNASPQLARVRQELRVAQERLLSTLDRLVHNGDVKPYLQDALVTQRQGRYVIPVRAEHKGQVDGIIHDQSASGATLFVEPIRVVEQNNAVRGLELDEEKEVRRILTELTELVADEAHYVRRNIHVLAELDFTFAKAKYAYTLEATTPEMVPFRRPRLLKPREISTEGRAPDGAPAIETTHPGAVVDLHRARHPLLEPESVVPIDVYLDEETFLIVITGPNTGGKTVTLKTVGLMALMAQAGLMIPVDQGSKLSVFEGIFADIGDEQSIEQNLSTFSSHMTNIIRILEDADPRSLVLLDELGAGTDPDEGSALAMALLENLRDRGITTFSTTHYSDLKLYAHSTTGVRNASVEFDVESLSPTFELSIGLPGRSNALTIARRLGLNPVIVDHAENIVRPDTLEADSLLDDIKRARQEARMAEDRARNREQQAQLSERDLRFQLANIEEARREVIGATRETMQQELEEAREEIKQIRRQLTRGELPTADVHADFLQRAEEEIVRRQQVNKAVDRDVFMPGDGDEAISGPIEVGDRVWVSSLQASGEVLNIHKRTEEADVQLGNFRLKLPLKRLELRQKAARERATESQVTSYQQQQAASPGIELDLRGARVEESLSTVERYVDRAHMARLPWVRIIHGKGTGALRDAIRASLRQHPLVSELRAGGPGEGGDGVTVAKLMEDR